MKLKIIGIILLLLLIPVSACKKVSEAECSEDGDCGFFYTKYGESSCVSCSYADEEWICMNKIKGEEEIKRRIQEYFDGNPPLCEPCLETDHNLYTCKCIENKCMKIQK